MTNIRLTNYGLPIFYLKSFKRIPQEEYLSPGRLQQHQKAFVSSYYFPEHIEVSNNYRFWVNKIPKNTTAIPTTSVMLILSPKANQAISIVTGGPR